ncbi:MAG: pilus assembly protein [Rhizobiales bacterium]|jgi:Flp pilus assembly protein TadG|nr:pilus assembly protein [Hyphomicrobiales bacterium]
MIKIFTQRSFAPQWLTAFAAENRGAAAIEFAMLLPLMITLYLGCVEFSQAISIDRKVSLTSRVLSDLVAQTTSVSNDDMTNIKSAAAAVTAPYSTTYLTLKISSVKIDANKNAKIVWGDALNTTARQKGDSVTIPTGLLVANTTLIWAEATYSYTPTIGYVITGTLPLHDEIYMRPRLSDCVLRPPNVTSCT